MRLENDMIACSDLQRYKHDYLTLFVTLPQRRRTLRATSDHWSFEDVQVIEEVCIVHIFNCSSIYLQEMF